MWIKKVFLTFIVCHLTHDVKANWQILNGDEYYISTEAVNFHQAIRRCDDKNNSKLVSIHNEEKNALLAAALTPFYYWIGLQCRQSPTITCPILTLNWMDGTPVTYPNAIPTDPSFGPLRGQALVMLPTTGYWLTVDFAAIVNYICENPINICASAPCQNGGSCVRVNNENDAYICECTDGFPGDHCQYGKVDRFAGDQSKIKKCGPLINNEDKHWVSRVALLPVVSHVQPRTEHCVVFCDF